ncbi:nuclear transport factor 2 family protein [Tenacibaculum sp. ZH5_bin.1]|uniref:nuclear transport factor 2 family protein n=1 Tax=Tenacibaculum TaxID=104267 RepID=UPI0014322548|nr:nuclear transport factor 2 family protein [Tenacibaculum mesophilum]KAF9660223.1 nuclear transport factor 2 family protein [Tenacibaculum mesophilum]
MKYLLTIATLLTAITIQGKTMTSPKDIVLKLFKASDERDWSQVEDCFNIEVVLDYSSMGSPATTLKPSEITSTWKTILPGFTYTHHQISNLTETINGETAKVFAYGTATHYLEDDKGHVWTVVGTYNLDLKLINKQWKITKMIFNFKYQDGNLSLPQKAINNVTGHIKELSTSEKNIRTVKAFFKALEDENAGTVANLFAEDGKQINPYHSDLFPKGAQGQAGIKAYWEPVFPNFDGMTFNIEDIFAMENTAMVYAKYTGHIKLKHNAGIYSNNYYSTFKFNTEGKITEYVEIFNPIVAARGFGLIDKIK